MTALKANDFKPRLWNEPGVGWCYEDGVVTASVSVTPEGVTPKAIGIFEWSSDDTGKGYTTRSLQWFRQQGFERIEAHSVGMLDEVDGEMVGDISTYYWARMHAKGLCDALYDDEGAEIEVIHGDPAIGPELRHRKPHQAMPIDELIKLVRLHDKDLDTHGRLAEFLDDLEPVNRSAVIIFWAAESHSIDELRSELAEFAEDFEAHSSRRAEVLSVAMNLAADHNDLVRGRQSEVANSHVIAICRELLALGAEPGSLGTDGLTVLHRATINGNLNIMQLMLDSGCPVDVLDKNGNTPLRSSIESSAYTSSRLLLRRGADPDAMPQKNGAPQEGALSLCELAEYRLSSSQSWLLLAYGASKTEPMLQDRRFSDATPAFAAMKAGDVERMLELLSRDHQAGLKEAPFIREALVESMFSMDDQHEAHCRETLSALDAFTAKAMMDSIADLGKRSKSSPH